MSYAVGNRQFPTRYFCRAIFDENPGGNGSNFRPIPEIVSLIAPHNIVSLFKEKSERTY